MGFKTIGDIAGPPFRDRVRMRYVAVNYTPAASTTAEATDQLGAHVKGIDDEIGAIAGSMMTKAYTEVDDGTTTTTATGADTLTVSDPLDVTGGTLTANAYTEVGDGATTTAATGAATLTVSAPLDVTGGTLTANAYTAISDGTTSTSASGADTATFRGVGGIVVDVDVTDGSLDIDGSTVTGSGTNRYTAVTGNTGTGDMALGADSLAVTGTGLISVAANAGVLTTTAQAAQDTFAARITAGTGNLEAVGVGDLTEEVAAVGAFTPGWNTSGTLVKYDAAQTGPTIIGPWAVNFRYFATNVSGTETITATADHTYIYYSHIYVPETYGLNYLSCSVVTSAGGLPTSSLRMGLYDDQDGKPYTKLFDSGNITASTGIKQSSVAALTLDPGHYWLAFTRQAHLADPTPTFQAAPLRQVAPWIGEKDTATAGTFGLGITAKAEVHAFGTLPATANATITLSADLVLVGLSRGPV